MVMDCMALTATIENLYHTALVVEMRLRKWTVHFYMPAGVTSPLRHLKRIKHDVIALKSAFKRDDLYQC